MRVTKRAVLSKRQRRAGRALERIQRGKLEPIVVAGPKIGRNDPCPCGRMFHPETGPNRRAKFKECCGFAAEPSLYQPCAVSRS